MDPNAAIALARELASRPAREREEYYQRTGTAADLRREVEALLDPSTTTHFQSRTAVKHLIGRYEVIRLLGRGGMGHVFLAYDPVLDRENAVKLISSDLDDADARQRLIREARAAGRLRHPNIVTIFDAGDHEGNPYIAMEYLAGETLRSLIRRKAPVPLSRRLELTEGACAGLAHAHRANVVHFDVKPDNLMLDATGVIKVVDFGIARTLRNEVLVTQHVAGTLQYMSPEQLTGGPLDRRSDVFSLGCSVFELFAYQSAYSGSAAEVIARISTGPAPRLADVLPSVDPRIDALVSRCMASDPVERFDDLDELAAALRQLRLDVETGVPPPSSRAAAVSPAPSGPKFDRAASVRSSGRRLALGVGATGLAALAGAAIWMRPPVAPGQSEAPSAATTPSEISSRSTVVQPSATSPSSSGAVQSGATSQPLASGPPAPAPPSSTGPPAGAPLPAAAAAPEEVWRRLARGDRAGVLGLVRGMEQGAGTRLAYEVFEAVRPSVQQARDNVPSAQRTTPAFHSGEEALNRGSVLAQNRQPTEALAAIWQAMDLYASAGAAAKPLPAPPQASQNEAQELTSRFPAVAPETSVPTSPAIESQNVLAALKRYQDAFRALNVSALQRIYPSLSSDELEQYRRTFEMSRSYELDVREPRVEVRSNSAIVRARVVRRTVPRVGAPSTMEVGMEFHLRREDSGWVITAANANP